MSSCSPGSLLEIRSPSSTSDCECGCSLSDLISSIALSCIGSGAGDNMDTILGHINDTFCTIDESIDLSGSAWCVPNASTPPPSATIQEVVDFISSELIPRSGNDCECPVTDFVFFENSKGIGHCFNLTEKENKVYFENDYTYIDSEDQIRTLNDLKVQVGGFGATQLSITTSTDLSGLEPYQLALTYNIDATSGNITLTLPEITTTLGFSTNRIFAVHRKDCVDANTVTIEPYGAETIETDVNRRLLPGESWIIHALSGNWNIIAKKSGGCSDTDDGFTEGYVTFGDAYGWLAQDLVNIFFYDETNGRLGLGTASPNEQLEITKNFRFPASTSTVGIFYQAANRFLHTVGHANNLFLGVTAGNLSIAGGNGNNIGIGTSSLQSLAAVNAGEFNVAMGTNSGQLITTGDFNTFLGTQAGRNAQTAASNVGIGEGALYGNAGAYSGASNVAVGRNSLYDITTGSFNVVAGESAGENLQNGTNNVFLGYQAGFTATQMVGSVLIGYQAGLNETGSGKLYIENSSSTTPLIGGDFTNNRVAVNTLITALNSTFSVDGSISKTIDSTTTSLTLDETQYTMICDSTSGSITLTLPAASTCPGRIYVIKKTVASNSVIIDPVGTDTIDLAANVTLTNVMSCRTIQSNSVDGWWVIAN